MNAFGMPINMSSYRHHTHTTHKYKTFKYKIISLLNPICEECIGVNGTNSLTLLFLNKKTYFDLEYQ